MPAKKQKFIVRNAYERGGRVYAPFEKNGKTKTKQSMRDECDINMIMARYMKTGAIDHVNRHGPQYGFASSLDFSESMRLVKDAQQMFDDLPSPIRTKFQNDPGQFLDFVQDDANASEMAEMGLTQAPTRETAPPVPEASEQPPEDASPPEKEAKVQLST